MTKEQKLEKINRGIDLAIAADRGMVQAAAAHSRGQDELAHDFLTVAMGKAAELAALCKSINKTPGVNWEKCPECGSTNVATEKRPNGNSQCIDCTYSAPTEDFRR